MLFIANLLYSQSIELGLNYNGSVSPLTNVKYGNQGEFLFQYKFPKAVGLAYSLSYKTNLRTIHIDEHSFVHGPGIVFYSKPKNRFKMNYENYFLFMQPSLTHPNYTHNITFINSFRFVPEINIIKGLCIRFNGIINLLYMSYYHNLAGFEDKRFNFEIGFGVGIHYNFPISKKQTNENLNK